MQNEAGTEYSAAGVCADAAKHALYGKSVDAEDGNCLADGFVLIGADPLVSKGTRARH